MPEHIKIERWQLIEHLLSSWRDHYEQMDNEFLINEYLEYLSEDPDADITVEIIEENE
jgi:DNA gyrase inhibitor GyrI